MQINSKVFKDTLYITLNGELDEYTSSYTRDALDDAISSKGFSKVIIDLQDLLFMDSTGIGVLIGRYKKLKPKNIPIYICNPSSHIEKIFKISGLNQIMPKIA